MAKRNRSLIDDTVVVILAAGKGSRMGNSDLAKVCFEIDGVAAISRTIRTFGRLGFRKFMLVVGNSAQCVMDVASSEDVDITYVYQNPPRGTGHAAACAADALKSLGFGGRVLLTMGDKFIEPMAVDALIDGFVKQNADMALLSIPKTKATEASGGRIFIGPDSQAADIIEKSDIARQAIADGLKAFVKGKTSSKSAVKVSAIERIIEKNIPQARKRPAAVGDILELIKNVKDVPVEKITALLEKDKYNLSVAGQNYTAKEIETKCCQVNPSMYLFDAEAFYRGVSMIGCDNAQQEYYLTDIVRCLSSLGGTDGGRLYNIRTVPIDDPQWVQGFNSPDELLAIQDYVRKNSAAQKSSAIVERPRLSAGQFTTVSKWMEKIESDKPRQQRWFNSIYGSDTEIHRRKRRDILAVLKCYGRKFGFDQKVCIVRAPGRVNLMGRHVDHRGGCNNVLAIDRETIAVAGLRTDSKVVAVNTRPGKFRTVNFDLSELVGKLAWSEWIDFVNSDTVSAMLRASSGQWGNYIKAAMLRLQHEYQDVRLGGINMAVTGDIPMAAGLSSSSSVVVATLQAAIALNNFSLTSQQFIDLCGQGEWFVGSRGGAGDHAAIYLGQRGRITQVGYLPFEIKNVVEAPADYRVLIANSHIKAAKSSGARDMFNSRIACYNLGLEILKIKCPQYAPLLKHLRDLDPRALGCNTSDIYRCLLKVPAEMSAGQIRQVLGAEHRELVELNFANHKPLASYNLRGVLLYGAAEVARAARCIEHLQSGRIDMFGELMCISHDGDRVSTAAADGRYSKLGDSCTDEYLEGLIGDLASEDPQKVLNAQLYMQPGSYLCSTEQIDRMVDIVTKIPGVAGAQLAGAGMGGCIMILAHHTAVEDVQRQLTRRYYRPGGLKPAVISCTAVEGAGLIEL